MVLKGGLVTALAASLIASGCGDSNDDGNGSADRKQPEATGASRCVELWNGASADLRAKASLSHRGDTGEADVVVGTYSGEAFSATGDSFDEEGLPTSADVSVARGDCVAVDLTSNESVTNWVMVLAKTDEGAGAGWYFLDETAKHPLAKPPQPLDRPAQAEIIGFGEEAKLTTDGP